jgi:protein-S-isoprenylcysteine O-methyltransferase Ste14
MHIGGRAQPPEPEDAVTRLSPALSPRGARRRSRRRPCRAPASPVGPYRLLRHPGYAGIALILIGISLLYGTWIGLAAMTTVPTGGLVNRIRVEERALNTELAPKYIAYAARRKRMIPYVW